MSQSTKKPVLSNERVNTIREAVAIASPEIAAAMVASAATGEDIVISVGAKVVLTLTPLQEGGHEVTSGRKRPWTGPELARGKVGGPRRG